MWQRKRCAKFFVSRNSSGRNRGTRAERGQVPNLRTGRPVLRNTFVQQPQSSDAPAIPHLVESCVCAIRLGDNKAKADLLDQTPLQPTLSGASRVPLTVGHDGQIGQSSPRPALPKQTFSLPVNHLVLGFCMGEGATNSGDGLGQYLKLTFSIS